MQVKAIENVASQNENSIQVKRANGVKHCRLKKKIIIYKTSMRVREENIDEKEKRNENLLDKLPFGFFLFL